MLRLTPLFLALMTNSLQAKDPLEAFPPADKGMTRHVLRLDERPDEPQLKVQLILGKSVQTDTANRYFFTGNIETRTLEGWGYSYHILPEIGPMAGTLMATPSDAPKARRFIALGGEPYLIRYNSKLPVVIYTPKGVKVRYRLWRGENETRSVEQG